MGETVGSVSGHFRKVAISLHYLLNHEDFTDLTFVCSDGPVHCHKAMLLTHSPLLKYLFGISASHQASDTTVISLPQVEKITMIKLLQYVYKGKASFKKDQDLSKLYELAEVLDFDMSFAKKDPEDDGPRQTAVTSRTKKKKDANKKKQKEEKEAAKQVQDEDLTSALIKKFQGQAQSPNKPDPVNTVLEESPTKKTKDATKTKQTEEKEAAKEVQDEDLSSNLIEKFQNLIEKFQGQAQRQTKPAPVVSNGSATPKPAAGGFSCELCGITATSNDSLNMHLLGAKHKKKLSAGTAKRKNNGGMEEYIEKEIKKIKQENGSTEVKMEIA